MDIVNDRELNARLTDLGNVEWNKSLLAHTRCPFLRAAAAARKLDIKNGDNHNGKAVLKATVHSVSEAGGGPERSP